MPAGEGKSNHGGIAALRDDIENKKTASLSEQFDGLATFYSFDFL